MRLDPLNKEALLIVDAQEVRPVLITMREQHCALVTPMGAAMFARNG